jgi:hypothetical protein
MTANPNIASEETWNYKNITVAGLIPVLRARTSCEIDGYAINDSQKRLITVGECALLRFSH